MTTPTEESTVWVGAGLAGVRDRLTAATVDSRHPSQGCSAAEPVAVLTVADTERRLPDAALKVALELMAERCGVDVGSVALLLVFSSSFATAHTRRLVERVATPGVRLRPRDSTDMETSESIRWTLEQLERGVPDTTLILASPFDPGLVRLLCPPGSGSLVLRYLTWGDDPRQTDVLLGYRARHLDALTGSPPMEVSR
jgi:hypothetical protein